MGHGASAMVAEPNDLVRKMAPKPDEQLTVKTETLKSIGQPSRDEKEQYTKSVTCHAEPGVQSVQARGVVNPHRAQDKHEEGTVRKVMFDMFFSGSDQLAQKEVQTSARLLQLSKKAREARRGANYHGTHVGCETQAQGTL